MSNMLTYRGYYAPIEFDAEDGIFVGKIADIRDGIGFHADTVEGLRSAFREAVDDYVEACAQTGKEPERPYSGKLMLRVSPAVHASAARAAKLSGKSLNAWGEAVLNAAAETAVGR